jgi:hypothetical protein
MQLIAARQIGHATARTPTHRRAGGAPMLAPAPSSWPGPRCSNSPGCAGAKELPLAEEARAARDVETHHHPVPRRQVLHLRANLVWLAEGGRLVARQWWPQQAAGVAKLLRCCRAGRSPGSSHGLRRWFAVRPPACMLHVMTGQASAAPAPACWWTRRLPGHWRQLLVQKRGPCCRPLLSPVSNSGTQHPCRPPPSTQS